MDNLGRSFLYKLDPVGYGSPFIETLTSYITRLAGEHLVSVGHLLDEVIAPVIGKAYISRGVKKSSDPFFKHSYKINGVGQEARDFAGALTQLTTVQSLDHLTMTLIDWLPAKGLLKSSQAWCPACYGEWAARGQTIYSPLIWSFTPYILCKWHDVPLEIQCPGCGSKVPHLSRENRIGYCPRCNRWLGRKEDYNTRAVSYLDHQRWVSEQVAYIVQSFHGRPNDTTAKLKNNLILMLSAYQKAGFNKKLAIPKTTWHGWIHGSNIPTISHLLRICYAAQIGLDVLLEGEIQKDKIPIESLPTSPAPENSRRGNKSLDLELTLERLGEVISNDRCAPSLEQVARDLNLSAKTIRKYFPVEAKNISTNYLNARSMKAFDTREKNKQLITNAVIKINADGQYPSKDLVEIKCGKPALLRQESLGEFWKSLL